MTPITAKTIRQMLLTGLALAAVVVLGGLQVAQAGVDVWTATGPEGGTIQALAIDPQNPATLYAAVRHNASPESTDVYKSTDAGSSWRAVAIGLPDAGALAIDPQTPTTLYLGLGGGHGIYNSTDGAGSWSLASTGLGGGPIYSLAIDPQTPTTRPRAPASSRASTGATTGMPSTASTSTAWSSTPRRRPPSTGAPSSAASSRARTGVPAGARSTPA
jgi:hypothetical protein